MMTESDVELIIEEDESDLEDSDAVFDEIEESLGTDEVQNSQDKSIFVSQREIISIIFSKSLITPSAVFMTCKLLNSARNSVIGSSRFNFFS